MEKRRGIIIESVDRAYRIKCEINFIGGARSGIGPLARFNGIKQLSEIKRLWNLCSLIYLTVKKDYMLESTTDRSRSAIKGLDH